MKIPEDAVAQEGVLESITKEGVPSAETIATTKPQKRRKHSNKRRLSGKGLPTGERSKAPASASSVRKISWQCDNLPSDPQEDEPAAASPPKFSSSKLKAWGTPPRTSFVEATPLISLADSPALGTPTSVSVASKLDVRVPRLPRVANISPTDTTDQMGNTTKPVYTYRSSASEKLNHPAPPVSRHQQQKSTA
ncbi:hypothetical protein MRX96_029850 [Rhipicephalus microplus]